MIKFDDDFYKKPKLSFHIIKIIIFLIGSYAAFIQMHKFILSDFDDRFFSQAYGQNLEYRVQYIETKIDKRLEVIESDIKLLLKESK